MKDGPEFRGHVHPLALELSTLGAAACYNTWTADDAVPGSGSFPRCGEKEMRSRGFWIGSFVILGIVIAAGYGGVRQCDTKRSGPGLTRRKKRWPPVTTTQRESGFWSCDQAEPVVVKSSTCLACASSARTAAPRQSQRGSECLQRARSLFWRPTSEPRF